MLPKDYEFNIKLSLYKFLKERISATHFVNYSDLSGKELEKRQTEKANGWWRWIDVHWLKIGEGIFSVSLLQLNCNTIIENDRFGAFLEKMGGDLQEELNVDTIPLLDFGDLMEAMFAGIVTSLDEAASYPPAATDNVLVPRFRGTRTMPNAAEDTVAVKALDWNVYVWRESVLP